ncbi:MAG: hypothetical protein ACJAVV_002340 [Alphaproteobacteria bacterium]|jgi:hypothetical protein
MIENGVSDTLLSIFEGIREATCVSNPDRLKYHYSDVDELVNKICKRNYGFLCFELSHFCWAIVNKPNHESVPSALMDYFWFQEPTTPKRFREVFKSPWESECGSIKLTNDVLSINVSGGKFDVSPTRSGTLASLMEFLITIDTSLLKEIEKRLLEANNQKIKEVASYLQKEIREFLKPHLVKEQVRNRFTYIVRWLKSNEIDPGNIDDQDVLSFWLAASGDEESEGYVLYSTALFSILDASDAFYTANQREQIAWADSFGDADAEGEVDVGKVAGSLVYEERPAIFVDALSRQPKCITQIHVKLSEPLVNYQNMLSKHGLSFLRLHCFSALQSVLVQAKRVSQQRVYEKLQENFVGSYLDYCEELDSLLKSLIVAKSSLLYVLTEHYPSEVFSEHLQSIFSENNQQTTALKEFLKKEPGIVKSFADSFSKAKLASLCLQFPIIKQQYEHAATVFRKNTKQGFRELPHEEDIEQYYDCLENVNNLIALMMQHKEAINDMLKNKRLNEIFVSDLSIFNTRFTEIYGETYAV